MHSLFIGLGGAGTYAVAELKRKMLNFGYDVKQDNFLFIDTEQKIRGEYDFIGGDFVPISGDGNESYSVKSVRSDAKNWMDSHSNALVAQGTHFFTWFDDESPSLKSNRDLTNGAEGARMFTRVMLWHNYDRIKSRISNALSYQDENGVPKKIERIYLVSGTCGGTGSGSVLDIMYLLGEIKDDNKKNDVDFRLTTILVMPHGYIKDLPEADVRKDKYQTNAYAMLDEINACTKDFYIGDGENDGKSFFRYRCMGSINQEAFGFNVCNNLFMLDSYDNKYKRGALNYSQVSDNVSNFLFAMESGSAAQEISEGNFCNITNTQIQSTVKVPYIKGFCATGLYVVQTWEEIVRKYVKERFIYQMFQHGFVGSDAFELSTNDVTLVEANNDFSKELEKLKKEFYDSAKADINQVFSVDKANILKIVASNMNDALATKENKLDEIFSKHPKQENWENLHSMLNDYLEAVKKATYSFCMKLVKRYSLRHAKALIGRLDGQYDKAYKEKMSLTATECSKVFDALRITRPSTLLKGCKNAFENYIDYLVARNLSNENDGYLDVCGNSLSEAIDNIQIESRKLPESDVKIKDWHKEFGKYLTSLRADQTRKFIPELPENLLDQKSNNLFSQYESLVAQNGDNPDFSLDLTNKKLLYTFKHEIMDEMLHENGSWERDWFVIKDNANTFAEHCSTILDDYMRRVVEKANSNRLSRSETLSIPFMDVYKDLDAKKKDGVIEALVSYADVTMSMTKAAENYGTITGQTVYLSNGLDKKEGLGKTLLEETKKKISGGQMGVNISGSVISDRLIKLYVRSGYGFDDYEYFDEYGSAFDTYYGNPSSDQHQCFIHKEFLKAKLESKTLNEMFDSDTKKAYQEDLKNQWRGKEGMIFKFAILLMARVLLEQKETSLMKHFDPIDGFIKEERSETPKSWRITLGKTNDLKNNPKKPQYSVNASSTFNLLNTFNRADIEAYKSYIEFWFDILKKLAKKADVFLTDTKMNDLLENAYYDLNLELNDVEQDGLNSLKESYGVFEIDKNGNVQVDDYEQPILKQWRWSDFFQDCLFGLFDR